MEQHSKEYAVETHPSLSKIEDKIVELIDKINELDTRVGAIENV